jgi:hypothetical protein
MPAHIAAPRAVVSVTTGRSTGTLRMSARNCMTQSLRTMPPSTRSSAGDASGVAAIAVIRSRVW